jgi:hypothetical protein
MKKKVLLKNMLKYVLYVYRKLTFSLVCILCQRQIFPLNFSLIDWIGYTNAVIL